MERVTKVELRGIDILRVDFSNASPEEMLATLDMAHAHISVAPAHSVLTLTIVKGAHYNAKVSDRLKRDAVHNRPFIKASAIVGLNGLQRIIYSAIIKFSGRVIAPFDDEDDALMWLVGQGLGAQSQPALSSDLRRPRLL